MLITYILSMFVQKWMVAMIAVLLARYAKYGVTMPPLFSQKFSLYFKVWVLTFVSSVAFTWLAVIAGWSKNNVELLGDFVFPIAVGIYFARTLMIKQNDIQNLN